MKIGINQFCFPNSYDVEVAICSARKLGFSSIELCFTAQESTSKGGVTDSLDISSYHNRLFNTNSTEKEVFQLKRVADDNGIAIDSTGGIVSFSIYPLNATDESIVKKCMDSLKKMLDFSMILGAKVAMVIPGMLTEDMSYEESYHLSQERLFSLCNYAPDITIAIENVWNNYLYSPLELNHFVDEIGTSNIGIYFDIANARRFGYPQQWIYTMGHRIKALHLKDYRISVDTINGFTNLLDGDVNYPEVRKALQVINFTGPANVELLPPAKCLFEKTLVYAKEVAEEIFKDLN